MVVSTAALVLFGLVAPRAEAQTGTLTGRVVSASAAGGALESARVSIIGTNLGAMTNREGVYTIRGVPAGTHTVRALRLGYSQTDQPVTVPAGGNATLDFSMAEAPFSLEEITTTATGEARKLEVGNTINTIQVSTLVETGPVRDLAQIIAARAPGVQVIPSSGTTGTGNRVRIRGSNSVSLSNEPLYIIDGVRANSSNGDQGFGIGGQAASRLQDINPEEIADIQVLKGPSASAIYGTGGSNGVIIITTKRGVAGRAKWNFWGEVGTLADKNPYPDNYYGQTSTGARCRLYEQAAGSCTISEILSYNPLRNEETTPLANGNRQQLGGSISGGSDAVQYFVSGEWEGELGVFKMGAADQARKLLASGRTELRDQEIYPNQLSKWNMRANTNFILNPKTSAGVNVAYVMSDLQLPQNDNNVRGVHSSGVNGDGRGPVKSCVGDPDPDCVPNLGRAWGFFSPGDTFQYMTTQTIGRLFANANANWNPTTWLSTRAIMGLDRTERIDQQLNRFGEGPAFGIDQQGFAGEDRNVRSLYTADVGGTASFNLNSRLTSKTSAGFQYSENNSHTLNGNGDILPPGSVTVTSTSIKRTTEGTGITKSVGGYLEQVFGYDDRLFVTGSVRVDRNSSTGIESKAITYPKAAISYLTPWLDGGTFSSLRLRASYGTAGQQPGGTTAKETFFTTQAPLNGLDGPAVGLNNFGDPTLKAEFTSEFEGGFDLGLFNGRAQLELTGYSKKTQDALINVTTPTSLGNPGGQFRNVGTVKNEGIEMILNAQVLTGEKLTWDLTLTGSLMRNELLNLPSSIPFIQANGTTQQHRTGYPLGGYWGKPYTYNDANGDNILVASEVTVGDTNVYLGTSAPTREMALNTVFGLFKGRVLVATTFDYHGGNNLWNLQEDFRCRSRSNCDAMYNIDAPLDDKARMVALMLKGANNTTTGFIENAEYMKWRELSVTFLAPDSWANAMRASRLSFTFAGRNLATWTGYSGPDPEVNGQGEANFAQRDFLSLPPIRVMSFRVNLTF